MPDRVIGGTKLSQIDENLDYFLVILPKCGSLHEQSMRGREREKRGRTEGQMGQRCRGTGFVGPGRRIDRRVDREGGKQGRKERWSRKYGKEAVPLMRPTPGACTVRRSIVREGRGRAG